MAELEERTPVHPRQRRLRRLLMVSACVAVSLALLWWRHINTVPRYAMPRPALPQPNAFDYYLSAGDALDSLRGYPLVQSPSTSPEYLALVVEANEAALATFHAGLRYPFLTPLPDSQALARRLPYLESFRRLGNLLWAESRAALAIDDVEGALEATFLLIRLGIDVTRGGILTHVHVGRDLEQRGLAQLAVVGKELDAQQCRHVLHRLRDLEARRPPLTEAIHRERDLLREFLWRLSRRQPDAIHALDTFLRRRWSSGPRLLYLINLRGAHHQLIQRTDEAARLSTLPAGQRAPLAPATAPLIERFDLVRRLHSALQGEDLLQTRSRLLQTALALRAYHLEQGRSPDSLDDLVPRYLPSLPPDPYGEGDPLRYQARPEPYAYSLGPDSTDDGGHALPWRWLNNANDPLKGDLRVILGEYDMWRSR
ncbi:MAG TPA: hypothetical protein GX715_11665 [Armatimonadetes bacterium]|nr:hypothetical protein [Armatimonadota bacterium]